MRMKLRTTTVAVVALMLGMVAAPALAQDADDPEVASLEACLAAFEAGFPKVLEAAGVTDTDSFAAWLEAEGFDVDEACEIDGSYVPEVLGVVIERPDNGTPDDDEIAAVIAQTVEPPSAAVLGVQLARTGLDAAVIALIGVGLLGLGVVAVRGTRRRTGEA